MTPEEIPSFAIDNEPGDLIVGNFRTLHATFGGATRRRLFTMNYRQVELRPEGLAGRPPARAVRTAGSPPARR